MSDLHQFRVRTPSFLITAETPAQVWHTSILNKLDQVVATSYTRNTAEVCSQLFHEFKNSQPLLSAYQMSAVQQAKVCVEQLRREAGKTRINVSQAIEEMKVNF